MRYENQEDMVLDHESGRIWQADFAGPMTWNEAMEYPATLGTEWWLPTAHELFGTVDLSRCEPASTFPGMPSQGFWSSSSYADNSSFAWYVYFADGYIGHGHCAGVYYVRCVRVRGWRKGWNKRKSSCE